MYYIAIILYHFHEYKENKREICILQVLAAVLATLQDLVTLRPRNNIKNCIWQKSGSMPVMYWVSCARDVLGMRRKGIKTIVVIELNL